MIFMPENITAMAEGRKGQSRRVAKESEELHQAIILKRGWRFAREGEPSAVDAVVYRDQAGKLRLKYYVGQTHAVCPGRGKPGVWWHPDNHLWKLPTDTLFPDSRYPCRVESMGGRDLGWRPLRIRITAIRRERVQDISEEDARAEGWPEDEDKRECPHCDALYPTGWYDGPNRPCTCNPVTWSRGLWNQINTRKGTRWEDNPDVWVLLFSIA